MSKWWIIVIGILVLLGGLWFSGIPQEVYLSIEYNKIVRKLNAGEVLDNTTLLFIESKFADHQPIIRANMANHILAEPDKVTRFAIQVQQYFSNHAYAVPTQQGEVIVADQISAGDSINMLKAAPQMVSLWNTYKINPKEWTQKASGGITTFSKNSNPQIQFRIPNRNLEDFRAILRN